MKRLGILMVVFVSVIPGCLDLPAGYSQALAWDEVVLPDGHGLYLYISRNEHANPEFSVTNDSGLLLGEILQREAANLSQRDARVLLELEEAAVVLGELRALRVEGMTEQIAPIIEWEGQIYSVSLPALTIAVDLIVERVTPTSEALTLDAGRLANHPMLRHLVEDARKTGRTSVNVTDADAASIRTFVAVATHAPPANSYAVDVSGEHYRVTLTFA